MKQIHDNHALVEQYEAQGAVFGGDTKLDKELTNLSIDTVCLYGKLPQEDVLARFGEESYLRN